MVIYRVDRILAIHASDHCLLVLRNDDVWIVLAVLVLCEICEPLMSLFYLCSLTGILLS